MISFSDTKGNFINDVSDKHCNSRKPYLVKIKSVNKNTKKVSQLRKNLKSLIPKK